MVILLQSTLNFNCTYRVSKKADFGAIECSIMIQYWIDLPENWSPFCNKL